MTTLIVTAGAPGAGKSTAVAKLADEFGFTVICPDAIRGELFGDEGCQDKGWLVFKIAYDRLVEALSDPDTPGAIFDATNCRKRSRREILKKAAGFYDTSVCAISNTDLETCLRRNASRERVVPEEVIENMYERLIADPPTIDEGFDFVVSIDEVEDKLRALEE